MKKASSSRLVLLTVLMSALIVVGIANYVLVKVLFVAFKSGNGNSTQNATSAFFEMLTAKTNSSDDGSRYSFFVNQGINFFYIVVGGIMVYPRMCCTNDITPEMKKIPHKIFVIMALLDSFGTFFISMGAVYTPGQIQPLIQQALIPLTMVFSCIWLKERYNIWELVGAVLMLAGAAVSIVPTITGGTDGTSKWYACVIYFCSNIPMALSGVYKEMAFKKQPVDVWYLSQWVAIYQFLISFVFVPLLVVPFIGGTETGMSFADIWYSFRDGALCWVQLTPDCSGVNNKGQMWLLPVYTCVNMYVVCVYVTRTVLRSLRFVAHVSTCALVLCRQVLHSSWPLCDEARERRALPTGVSLLADP